ncbi:MAG: Na/Pi symporter [Prolixibacteraceae bacterium]|jgi:Na/Pi-cotransporter|nr:Na/Pi symporter [Prolixibacteraceae bacterium]
MVLLAITSFVAGLGMFFWGLQTLTNYLKALTNKKVRTLIQRLTKTVFQGLFIGGMIIMVTQSLSALVFTLIGMIRAGALKVKQALPIIIGGNMFGGIIIYLVAIDIKAAVLAILGISAILYTSSISKGLKNYIGLFLGLALLFFGLETMQNGVSPLIEMPWIQELFTQSHGFYTIVFLVAALISILVHSSMATIIIGLALVKGGLLTFEDSMIIVYGANVGSSILTFMLSSKIKGQSKQIAMFQSFYNFLGAFIVIPLFILEIYGGVPLIKALTFYLSNNLATQLALLYTIFNIIPGLILLFILPFCCKLLQRYWPESADEKLATPKYLYDIATEDTDSALQLIALEQIRLIDITQMTFALFREEDFTIKVDNYHESFTSLINTIWETINELSTDSRMNAGQYEKLNYLINTQGKITILFEHIVSLASNFALLMKNDQGSHFAEIAIEGLDIILLTLNDVVKDKNTLDADFLRIMTSASGNGIETLRKAYLSQDKNLTSDEKMNLLSAMNQYEQIVQSLGEVGKCVMLTPNL